MANVNRAADAYDEGRDDAVDGKKGLPLWTYLIFVLLVGFGLALALLADWQLGLEDDGSGAWWGWGWDAWREIGGAMFAGGVIGLVLVIYEDQREKLRDARAEKRHDEREAASRKLLQAQLDAADKAHVISQALLEAQQDLLEAQQLATIAQKDTSLEMQRAQESQRRAAVEQIVAQATLEDVRRFSRFMIDEYQALLDDLPLARMSLVGDTPIYFDMPDGWERHQQRGSVMARRAGLEDAWRAMHQGFTRAIIGNENGPDDEGQIRFFEIANDAFKSCIDAAESEETRILGTLRSSS